MNSNPKILVFRMREMIYTLLLIVFAVLLVVCLFLMFSGRTSTENSSAGTPTADTQNESSQADTSQIQNGSSQTDSARIQNTGLQQTDSQIQSASPQQTDSRTHDAASQQTGSQIQSTAAQQAASASVSAENAFTPGIYTVPLYLNGASLEVEVTVDADHINSIRLVNLSESVEAMYPLMSPSLNHIATQILQKQSLADITSPQENRYTSQMLLNAISAALELAQ